MPIEEMQAYFSGELRAIEEGKFLYYPEASPVILQLECIEDGKLLVYCSFASDGSGLFLASFMTLLLTEESPSGFAVPAGMGCVTGSVSQTYFRILPPSKGRNNALQCQIFAAACMLFAHEMLEKSADLYDKNTLLEDRLTACNLADFRIAYLMENIDEAQWLAITPSCPYRLAAQSFLPWQGCDYSCPTGQLFLTQARDY